MNKIIAYYSIVVVVLAVILCVFNLEGDSATILGGVIFIPVAYSLIEAIREMRKIEESDKIKERIVLEEKIRKELLAKE